MTKRDKMRELSRLFAESCGLAIPHTPAPAGELHDSAGRCVWHWYKCPTHSTWMQPCFCFGIPHWHCKVSKCEKVKAAKMRTLVERELFRLMRYLEI